MTDGALIKIGNTIRSLLERFHTFSIKFEIAMTKILVFVTHFLLLGSLFMTFMVPFLIIGPQSEFTAEIVSFLGRDMLFWITNLNERILLSMITAQTSFLAIFFSIIVLATQITGGRYSLRFSRQIVASPAVWNFLLIALTSPLFGIYLLFNFQSLSGSSRIVFGSLWVYSFIILLISIYPFTVNLVNRSSPAGIVGSFLRNTDSKKFEQEAYTQRDDPDDFHPLYDFYLFASIALQQGETENAKMGVRNLIGKCTLIWGQMDSSNEDWPEEFPYRKPPFNLDPEEYGLTSGLFGVIFQNYLPSLLEQTIKKENFEVAQRIHVVCIGFANMGITLENRSVMYLCMDFLLYAAHENRIDMHSDDRVDRKIFEENTKSIQRIYWNCFASTRMLKSNSDVYFGWSSAFRRVIKRFLENSKKDQLKKNNIVKMLFHTPVEAYNKYNEGGRKAIPSLPTEEKKYLIPEIGILTRIAEYKKSNSNPSPAKKLLEDLMWMTEGYLKNVGYFDEDEITYALVDPWLMIADANMDEILTDEQIKVLSVSIAFINTLYEDTVEQISGETGLDTDNIRGIDELSEFEKEIANRKNHHLEFLFQQKIALKSAIRIISEGIDNIGNYLGLFDHSFLEEYNEKYPSSDFWDQDMTDVERNLSQIKYGKKPLNNDLQDLDDVRDNIQENQIKKEESDLQSWDA